MDGVLLRPVTQEDAGSLCDSYLRSRERLRPWDPHRDAEFHPPEGQAARLREQLAQRWAGRMMPWVLTTRPASGSPAPSTDTGTGAGTSTDTGTGAGAGRGLATAAVHLVCHLARERFGLPRVEAGTLRHNAASQRVLQKNDFECIGTARNYLHINGAWRDHVLFQRVLYDGPHLTP
ncbi:GNAT family N-acetyltransferase [Streptomyces sp. MST-110588]|nr:GNAT family N-acetyltransferase [Streptomyces sp. MST-110588]